MKALYIRKLVALIGALGLTMLIVLPTPAIAMGAPAFHIDSWSTDPADLTRGDEFTLTITFTNVGTYGANEVLVEIADDAYFTGLGTNPRFVEMGIGAQVTATLRVGISDTIETGFYSLPVQFSYHHAALGGAIQTEIKTIGVTVTGLSPFRNEQDTGAPQLVIEDSTVNLAEGGEGALLVTLNLHNTGNRAATNIVVNLDSSEIFSPADGASTAFAVEGDIDVDGRATVTIPLILIASPDGFVSQSFTIAYRSYSGGAYSDAQSVPILLDGVTAQTPHLLVQQYRTDPPSISPGAQVRLTLDVANLGDGPARDVFIRLGESVESLDPLAPVGSSNVLYIEEIPPQSTVAIGYDLAASGDAESGLVPIDVQLTYDSLYGIEYSEAFSISLQVYALPAFSIGLFQAVPETITVGDTFDLPIQVINIGQNSVNVNTIEVTSDILQISNGTLYIGQLDGGTSGSLIAQAEALQPGMATVVVTVNYLDDFQQPQSLTERLTFEVQAGAAGIGVGPAAPGGGEEVAGAAPSGFAGAPGGGEELTVWQRVLRGLLGFFGLGTRSPGMGGAFPGVQGQEPGQ